MIEIEKCLKVIKSGGIILYPTDTIYGLGCDAYNLNAIRKINIIKGSDPEKPLIYLMNDLNMVKKYVENIPDFAVDFLFLECFSYGRNPIGQRFIIIVQDLFGFCFTNPIAVIACCHIIILFLKNAAWKYPDSTKITFPCSFH